MNADRVPNPVSVEVIRTYKAQAQQTNLMETESPQVYGDVKWMTRTCNVQQDGTKIAAQQVLFEI